MTETSAIREWLLSAFNDEELVTFCFDRFQPVFNNFSAGMSKGQKIHLLIEYCQRHESLPELLAALERARPEQYARTFEVGPLVSGKVPTLPDNQAAIHLETGVVAICAMDSAIVGTGFVVTNHLLLTCAHVVEQARRTASELVTVRFHLNGVQQTVQIIPEYWRAPDADDIAVLRLIETLPAEVKPIKLDKAAGSDRHSFRSLGYPNVGDYVGIVADGTINGMTQKANGSSMVQLASAQLAQGHSGAPVWDEVQQRAIGMVSEVYHAGKDGKNRDTAFAIPTETLWTVCPELLRLTSQD
jgi:hypothetical protein